MKKRKCENCKYFEPAEKEFGDMVIGVCKDAIKRSRKLVPFSVNLDVSMVYGHGGNKCPQYTP